MIFQKKKKLKKKNNTVKMGTSLYDVNKGLVEKNVPDLTDEEMQNKKTLIIDFINNTSNQYYMLLCNEKKDYTIFRREMNENKDFLDNLETPNRDRLWNVLIDECLPNRGRTKSIELTENQDAVEIWISIEGESYCYMFFPYDAAIIEC